MKILCYFCKSDIAHLDENDEVLAYIKVTHVFTLSETSIKVLVYKRENRI